MPFYKTSARKMRFIENMILITFPVVLFAGCAGSDIKPETNPSSLTNYPYSGYENPQADSSTAYPVASERELEINSLTPDSKDKTQQSEGLVSSADSAPNLAHENTNDVGGESESKQLILSANKTLEVQPVENILYFATDKHKIRDDQHKQLQLHAKYLITNPSARLVINGHADIRGTEHYNHDLSEKRAKEIFDTLISLGVPQGQMVTKAFGELQPMNDVNNWDENRRVELDYADSVILSSR